MSAFLLSSSSRRSFLFFFFLLFLPLTASRCRTSCSLLRPLRSLKANERNPGRPCSSSPSLLLLLSQTPTRQMSGLNRQAVRVTERGFVTGRIFFLRRTNHLRLVREGALHVQSYRPTRRALCSTRVQGVQRHFKCTYTCILIPDTYSLLYRSLFPTSVELYV